MTIANTKLPTGVLDLTSIDVLVRALTHSTDTYHVDQNIGGLLMEPVKATVNLVSQEGEVRTNVMLCSGLPLDIIIAATIAYIATGQLVAAIESGDVVGRTCLTTTPQTCGSDRLIDSIAGYNRDVLITSLTP